jgi:hypothetical protein
LDRVSSLDPLPHNLIEPKISNGLSKSKGVVAVRLAIVPLYIAINKQQKLCFLTLGERNKEKQSD